VTLFTAIPAQAERIGAGIEILNLPGANNTFDTSTDGVNDQSRQNIDQSFTATFGPGLFEATSWGFRAGQTGSVIPYVAKATGPDSYEILAVGQQIDVFAEIVGVDLEPIPFGGNTFYLDAPTVLYAGIVNPMVPGSQNPVATNLNSGFQMDHDNNFDGQMSPAIVGGAVGGFGHANLARSYAFSIDVNAVPEPTAICLTLIVGAVALFKLRRA
jgi:hypothetical protein